MRTPVRIRFPIAFTFASLLAGCLLPQPDSGGNVLADVAVREAAQR